MKMFIVLETNVKSAYAELTSKGTYKMARGARLPQRPWLVQRSLAGGARKLS